MSFRFNKVGVPITSSASRGNDSCQEVIHREATLRRIVTLRTSTVSRSPSLKGLSNRWGPPRWARPFPVWAPLRKIWTLFWPFARTICTKYDESNGTENHAQNANAQNLISRRLTRHWKFKDFTESTIFGYSLFRLPLNDFEPFHKAMCKKKMPSTGTRL